MGTILPRLRGRLDRLDRLGVVLSVLCAAHCLAGIVLVALLGVGGGLLLDPAFHRVGLVIATLIAALAIGAGALGHRRRAPFVMAVIGLAFMASALTVGHGPDEMVLTVIGVALVAVGHGLNLRPPGAHRHEH